ncbi:hypothetical protein VPHD518_0063 [Vibrio phage D518]
MSLFCIRAVLNMCLGRRLVCTRKRGAPYLFSN